MTDIANEVPKSGNGLLWHMKESYQIAWKATG